MKISDNEVVEARREIAAEVFEEYAGYISKQAKNPMTAYHSPPILRCIKIDKTGIRAGRHCRLNVV